jgi:hypothetical protein
MSRRHPSLEDLEKKRKNIANERAKKSKANPEGRDALPFDLILKGRKYRHDFNPCAREHCALRNASADDIITLLAMNDTKDKPPAITGYKDDQGRFTLVPPNQTQP